jgi:hypothetical protein
MSNELFKGDGFVKSPSAALRFTFVVAAYLIVRLTPQSRSERDCAPCIWSFLLCHRNFDFLRNHQRLLCSSAFTLISSGFLFIMSQPFNLLLTSRSKRPSHPEDFFSTGSAALGIKKIFLLFH